KGSGGAVPLIVGGPVRAEGADLDRVGPFRRGRLPGEGVGGRLPSADGLGGVEGLQDFRARGVVELDVVHAAGKGPADAGDGAFVLVAGAAAHTGRGRGDGNPEGRQGRRGRGFGRHLVGGRALARRVECRDHVVVG